MQFEEIIKLLAKKENVSEDTIKKEIELALKQANLDCSAETFVFSAAKIIKDYI